MPLLGAHMSIAGGFATALRQAQMHRCPAVQIFTKAPSQWSGRPIPEDEAAAFRAALPEHGVELVLAHDSYLINLASPEEALRQRSVEAFLGEMHRAEVLGLRYLVMHPGAHLGAGEQSGLARVVESFEQIFQQIPDSSVQVLVENTAGQGTYLGHRLEHLAYLIEHVTTIADLGVCFDTCHAFAAGYALQSEAEYEATMTELDRVIGRDRVRVFHVNDSVRERGSRVDRHAGLGRGQIGLEAFRCLVTDARWNDRVMILETPKTEAGQDNQDAVNLGILREMIALQLGSERLAGEKPD
jgi:deoxyribonuclease-4